MRPKLNFKRCEKLCVIYIVSCLVFKNMTNAGPWWLNGKESACQCRGHSFSPWSGKIPHAKGQLSLVPQLLNPSPLEPVLRNRIHCNEKPAHRHEE